MYCLKCGRETAGEQAFCIDCQVVMEKYPVRPGTLVQLPKRKESSAPKKAPKRRTVPLEEQVKTLRNRVRILTILLLVCAVLIAAMVYPSVSYLMDDHFAIGQNYSSVTATSAPTGAAETTK